jgi:hypothetical protein
MNRSVRHQRAALLPVILFLASACTGKISTVSSSPPPSGGGGTSAPPPPGAAPADVGTVALRQLTITEYNATVRDLLGPSLHPARAAKPTASTPSRAPES